MTFNRVLIALDEGPIGARAVTVGGELAAALGAAVALVHVIDPALAYQLEGGGATPALVAELKRDAARLLEIAAAQIAGRPAWQFVGEGKAADQIVAAAEEWKADLIVVGTHGRSGVSRLVMGSTAEAVLRRATCPVVVVKG